MRSRLLGAAALAAALILVPTAANAAGSDGPTPYTVTAQTLTLDGGLTFEAGGHINYRVTKLDRSGAHQFNVQEDVPDNGLWPRGRYIGRSVYTWTDYPNFTTYFPAGYCITWVQISFLNEHFGEGGQEPVCTDPTTPTGPTTPVEPTTPAEPVDPTTPVEPVDPTTPVDPTDPTTPVEPVDPTTPVDPTDPTAPVEPVDPTTPVDPTDPTTPVEPVDPTTPVDPADPATPVEPVDPTLLQPTLGSDETVVTEVLAEGDPVTNPETAEVLAATGADAAALAALALAAVAVGGSLIVLGRRKTADD